jgi:RNA polymerase-binding protein DksA
MALTQQQSNELARALDTRRAVLLEEIRTELERSGEQHYIDLADRVADSGEASVADLLVDLEAAMTDRDMRELREIDAAQQRMRDGSYGTCRDCGGEIDFERLRANPVAVRCIVCQTQHEKSFAHGRTPTL